MATRIPDGALGDLDTRVLLAVMTQRHPTVTSIATAVDRSRSVTYGRLRRLEALGLLGWADVTNSGGTLRARVRPVSRS